ncbi:penicillin-binding protein activator [Alteromonas sp. ASW11-36]|uniref:Penicillin-binding protein activator n=1 Tax=Alteromonas arenosi TaxID=3055817 RepID=A0ABT7STG4_9ALTE|nr:penicillin-binding protein activator [Alteromonas sp. ASW11-36]MDM7859471.1 penicillin-binding protein activator [Alteromonas sp. ASW11-36]
MVGFARNLSPRRTLAATVLLGTAVLSGCGSTPQPVVQSSPTDRIPSEQVEQVTTVKTAEEWLSDAQSLGAEEQNLALRNRYLLEAANTYRQEQQCYQALVVLNAVKDTLANRQNQQLSDLLLAECAPAHAISPEHRIELLAQSFADAELEERRINLQTQLFVDKRQWLEAAKSVTRLPELNESQVSDVWQWLNQLDQNTLRQAARTSAQLRPWTAVIAMLNQYGASPAALQQAYRNFVTQYPAHPLAVTPPAELLAGLEVRVAPPQKVAVLLPLSGRLAAQGNAIKQGILTAYFDQSSLISTEPIELAFYDTETLTDEVIQADLQTVDLVVGPLLKENIERVSAMVNPSTVMLALNRIDQPIAARDSQNVAVIPALDTEQVETTSTTEYVATIGPRLYFALAPEDEAKQLARHVYNSGYRAPIMVHGNDAINQRLAAAFLAQWRALNGQTDNQGITVVSFDSTDSMREGVGEALDVAQSRDRIRQLERMLVPELYNVPRNRRDIDAIVAFASPEQTELLNPVIEASLSPFNNKDVPVYVTSRSIRFDVSKNQLRDLQNVHFIDLPWMMPEHQWQNLALELKTLYPNQRDSLLRLFALGYDAFSQFEQFPHMAAIPQLSVSAMSGQLSINSNNEVERQLPLAVIDAEQVRVIAQP